MSKRGTILVVDDDAESLRVLVEILQPEGYHVRPADSWQLAVASVSVQPPDLILLDIRMPNVDGFEVCRRLKAEEGTRDIPVIFQSAATDLADRVEGFRLGAVDYVTKPFQREELLARVRTHLALRHALLDLESRNAELEAKNANLESMLKAFVGRELKMVQLKARIKELEESVNGKQGYETVTNRP